MLYLDSEVGYRVDVFPPANYDSGYNIPINDH